jgi:hypothetical protein
VDVPSFLADQFYVKGSLHNTGSGFALEARNPMGNGTLVGIGRLSVDGSLIPVEAVSALRPGETVPLRAAEVTRFAPIRVSKGDRVELRVEGAPLGPGEHRLEVELYEVNLGLLRFGIHDRVAEG